jgi:cell division protein FtsZ
MTLVDGLTSATVFKLIGVGGGGGNAAHHMIASGATGVEYIFADTNTEAMSICDRHKVIQLPTNTLGATTVSEHGRKAAELAENVIRSAISGADLLFITVCLGGGTGTGAAPVIARFSKEMGIATVAVVAMPFEFEGKHRQKMADAGLTELRANVDSVIVIPNDKPLEILGDDVTKDEALGYVNDEMEAVIGGIVEITNGTSVVNVDFPDVLAIMREPGKAFMGTAVASGPDRARLAAEQSLVHPLLAGIDLCGAKGVLVVIAASKGTLKLSEVKLIMNTIRAFTSIETFEIFGTINDERLNGELRVTVVATGLHFEART